MVHLLQWARCQSEDRAAYPPAITNAFRAVWEYANGCEVVESTPTALQLARNNLCNFSCVHCFDHRPGNTVPRTRLTGIGWDHVDGLIEQTILLSFHGISEFMIDPEFFPIVERCARAGAMLSINTNGSVCTARHLEVLRQYPQVLTVTFSMDGATPETYRRIRGWDLGRIVRNIKAYVECFRERTAPTNVTLAFVLMRSTLADAVSAVYLAKALNVNLLRFSPLHEYEGLDWKAEVAPGVVFDYQAETLRHCVPEVDEVMAQVHELADALGVCVEAPARREAPEPARSESQP